MNLLAARYIDRWAGVAVHLGLHAVGRATGRRLPPPGATTPPSAGRTWARPRRVLAIKFYGLGNLVMILPTLAALRAAVPEVEIDFLTLPGNEALLEQSGLVARVLTVEVATFPRFARAVARLVQALRARGYADEEPVMRRNFDRRLALIERRVAPGALLDVGAALGFFVRAARARGWDARGIERSAYAAERAASSGVPVVHGDFLSAALVPASFTAVTLLDVLEHTADPRAYVRRARACLRPGGVLAIETADLAAPFARLAGRRYHFFTPPNHLTYFTRATLARLLAEEGFADPGFFRVGKWVTLRRLVYHVYTRAPRPALGRLVRVVERSGFARLAVPVNLGDDVLALARAAG